MRTKVIVLNIGVPNIKPLEFKPGEGKILGEKTKVSKMQNI